MCDNLLVGLGRQKAMVKPIAARYNRHDSKASGIFGNSPEANKNERCGHETISYH